MMLTNRLAFFSTYLLLFTSPTFAYFAYVTDSAAPAVDIINTATNAVIGTVSSSPYSFSSPSVIAITPDGKRGYIGDNTTLYVIDTNPQDAAFNTVIDAISLPAESSPSSIGITPDGKTLYLGDQGNSFIYVVDIATNQITATIALEDGADPISIAITPSGNYAYVAGLENSLVYVIDTNPSSGTYNTIITTIDFEGTDPLGIAITIDGKFAYVGAVADGFAGVVVVDTDPTSGTWNEILGIVAIGGDFTSFSVPIALAATPNGHSIYILDPPNSLVYVVDALDATVTQQIAVEGGGGDGGPFGSIAVTPDGTACYIATNDLPSVSAINTSTFSASPVSSSFAAPTWVAIAPLSENKGLYDFSRLKLIYQSELQQALDKLNAAGLP